MPHSETTDRFGRNNTAFAALRHDTIERQIRFQFCRIAWNIPSVIKILKINWFRFCTAKYWLISVDHKLLVMIRFDFAEKIKTSVRIST